MICFIVALIFILLLDFQTQMTFVRGRTVYFLTKPNSQLDKVLLCLKDIWAEQSFHWSCWAKLSGNKLMAIALYATGDHTSLPLWDLTSHFRLEWEAPHTLKRKCKPLME